MYARPEYTHAYLGERDEQEGEWGVWGGFWKCNIFFTPYHICVQLHLYSMRVSSFYSLGMIILHDR